MEEKPLFVTDNEDLPQAINVMNSLLKYPEGKMLIYSIFLNQSSYMYYRAENIRIEKSKKDKDNYFKEGNYRVQTSDTSDLTITYFHELCHYLTLSGQNWFRYCFEYHKDVEADTSELDRNGKSIVKYWDEVYGERKGYRISLIHLLL